MPHLPRKLNLLLLALLLALTGCTTIYQSDKITVIKTRFFGLAVSYNPANQLPEVKLGYGSMVYQILPTSTNQLYAPPYVDAFDLGQALNPFSTKIIENTAMGNTAVGQDGGGAIIPKLHPPKPTSSLQSPKAVGN